MPNAPRDLAGRDGASAACGSGSMTDFVRESFTQPREAARRTARDFLDRFPKQAYMSAVERWRELPDGSIEFTMRRLRSAELTCPPVIARAISGSVSSLGAAGNFPRIRGTFADEHSPYRGFGAADLLQANRTSTINPALLGMLPDFPIWSETMG